MHGQTYLLELYTVHQFLNLGMGGKGEKKSKYERNEHHEKPRLDFKQRFSRIKGLAG